MKKRGATSSTLHRLKGSVIVLTASLALSSPVFAQSTQTQPSRAAKDQKPAAAAPIHDISGTWAPANGPQDGVQANGVKAMPNDGKPEHQLPFTPYGLQVYKS